MVERHSFLNRMLAWLRMGSREEISDSLSSSKVPQRYIWGILLGFSLYHFAASIFWQFGSFYLFAGIGETAFLLIGLIGGLPVLIGLLGVYFWGSLSDRWHRRIPFIILGFIAQTISFFLYIFIQDSFTFLVVTCVAYLFSLAAVPMANAYLTEARTFKGGAVGLLLATSSVGWSVGAFTGGFLFTLIGMSGLFLLGGFAFIAGALMIGIIVREIPQTTRVSQPEEVPSRSEIIPRPWWKPLTWILLVLAAAVAISSLGVNGFAYFFGVYLVSEIGGTPLMIGIANGFASLFGLGVTLAAGHGSDRIGRKPVILVGFAGYAMFMLVYLFIFDPFVAMLLWFIPLYPLISTAGYAAAADLSKAERRGRAMSTIATANSIGQAFGPIIGGALVQFVFFTLRSNLVFALLMNAIAFLIVLLIVPETLKHEKKKQ
ncbi:MAG: MFS transporter [Promethearchaeota archaeon]